MFEAVSLCYVFGRGTSLTVLGESPLFHLLGVQSETGVGFSPFFIYGVEMGLESLWHSGTSTLGCLS